MSNLSKGFQCGLRLLLVLVCWSSFTCSAHDIGITKATFAEQANNHYLLRAQTGTNMSYLYRTPLLPEKCSYIGNPHGEQGATHRSWTFSCAVSLTADDTLLLPWQRDGVMLIATWLDGSTGNQLFDNRAGVIEVDLEQLRAGSGSWADAVRRYTQLGIEHILQGIDHLLFVLALLFITGSGWVLIKTITAFTIAHSITLGFATLGFIHVPPRPVEAIIALSIMFVCWEIMRAREGKISLTYQSPWLVAFAFGLLHGLGFAGALSDIGLPQSEIPVALLFFNVGVEIGQLVFVLIMIGIAQLLTSVFSKTYLKKVQVVPTYLIGTVAAYWFIERMLAIVEL